MNFRFKNVKPNELFPILELKKRQARLISDANRNSNEIKVKFQSKNFISKKDMVEKCIFL